MPTSLTLLDLAKMNGADGGFVELLDEAARVTPEITGMTFRGTEAVRVPGVGDSRTIKGTQYKTLVRTALPTFQFRSANAGVKPSASVYENRLVECFIADMLWQADKAVADASEDGAAAVLAAEADAIVTSGLMGMSKQFYYGRGNTLGTADPLGHPGLIDAVDSSLVVDATGSTASTGSSVWGVRWGANDVRWVFGNNAPFALPDPRVQLVADTNDSTKFFTAYIQNWTLWGGVQVKSKFSVGQIKNLTAQAGKGLTDALLGTLLSKYPVGKGPTCFFATKRSIEQLRASRTATNPTGAPAPTPVDFEGIPIIATDSILNTETIT